MESKYLEYKDEIVSLFWAGNGYQVISQHLIDKYNLKVKKQKLRVFSLLEKPVTLFSYYVKQPKA